MSVPGGVQSGRSRGALWVCCAIAILLAAGMLYGCGGTGGSSSSYPPAQGAGGTTSTSTVQTGTVVVNNQAVVGAKKRAETPTVYKYTGVDMNRAVRYGPVSRGPEAQARLEGVPVDVVLIHVDYCNAQGFALSTADIAVSVIPNGVVPIVASPVAGPTFAGSTTIEVINDSEKADSDVYVLLTGKGECTVESDNKLPCYTIGVTKGEVAATPVASLPVIGSLKSAYSGKLCKIYAFSPTKVDSGRLYVSYGQPVKFKNDTAPDNFSPNYRWDKMEFAFNTAGGDKGYYDLTSLDFFAIPMQLESRVDYDKTTTALQTMTFYASTTSLLTQIFNLDPATMASAFYRITPTSPSPSPSPSGSAVPVAQPSFNPTTDSLDNFARVLGPQTVSSQVKDGKRVSASPYPSMRKYLQALVEAPPQKGAVVSIRGKAGVDGGRLTTYDYQVRFYVDGTGYKAVCSPVTRMTNGPPEGIYLKAKKNLPADQVVTVYFPESSLDFNAYAANADSFSVGGLDAALVPFTKNSVYATIAGDVSSGLQFGYINGKYGNVTADWYTTLPTRPPFGAARTTNDGYYNPFAAFIYNLSDSYGFPFTDRLNSNNPLLVTVPMPNTPTVMRLTILPDYRLDAPGLTGATASGTSVTASWEAVSSSTSGGRTLVVNNYIISANDGWNPPIETTVPATSLSGTVTGLVPGRAYTITVRASGTLTPQGGTAMAAVSPQSMPLFVMMPGTPPPVGASLGKFELTFHVDNWKDGMELWVNAAQVSMTAGGDSGCLTPDVPLGAPAQLAVELKGPDPANPKQTITYDLANFLLQADPVYVAGLPLAGFYTIRTRMSDESEVLLIHKIGDKCSSEWYKLDTSDPCCAHVNVKLSPRVTPKQMMPVLMMKDTPSAPPTGTPTPDPTLSPIPTPTPTPGTYWPVAPPPGKFLVKAVKDGKVDTTVSGTVQFLYGTDVHAAAAMVKGVAEFDPTVQPYQAPVLGFTYVVQLIADPDQKIWQTVPGAWNQLVTTSWKSGLTGQADSSGVIYINVTDATNRTTWGN